MNDALKNIIERNSHRKLIAPAPSKEEMNLVFKAALRAPDHAWLRPSNFIEVQGKGLDRLSKAFQDFDTDHIEDLEPEKLDIYINAPYSAPMIVVLINTPKEHPKVPEVEQIMSTATAGQNILLALTSLGYAGIWRTGTFAFNKRISKNLGLENGSEVIGYIYTGTRTGSNKNIPNLNIDEYVNVW